MKHSTANAYLSIQDRFGLKLAARLSESSQALPHDISERLRAARMQSLDKHKQLKSVTASALQSNGGGTAALHFGNEDTGLWPRLVSLIPLLALAAGLIAIQLFNNDNRAKELAEIDTAILTDDLPTAAYTDPGFLQFLKSRMEQDQ
jgi:Protein of unknown function (DUF3619)